MRGTRRMGMGLTALLAVVALAALGTGAGLAATALQGGGAMSDEELIDALLELEQEVASLPPDEVTVEEDGTWAQFSGDFVGTKIALDAIADGARDLFVRASESGGPVASATADAARGLLVLRQGYVLLAEWESGDLAFPLGQPTGDAASVYADDQRGKAETGLSLVLDGQARRAPAFAILRDSAAADDGERAQLEDRYEQTVAFSDNIRPLLHESLSVDDPGVLRPVRRFGTSAPGVESRSQVMTILCIDRDSYTGADPGVLESPEHAAALGQVPVVDCPDLRNDNELRPFVDDAPSTDD